MLVDYKLGMGKEESSVFVDVFLYDGMGENLKEAYMRYFFLKIFKKMVFLSKRNFKMENTLKSILFFLPCVVCKLIGEKDLIFFTIHCAKNTIFILLNMWHVLQEDMENARCLSVRYLKIPFRWLLKI